MSSILVRHINFLDDKGSGPKEGLSLNYFWLLVILVLFVGSAGGYYYVQKAKIAALTQEIADNSAEVTRLQAAEMNKSSRMDNDRAFKEVLKAPIVWSDLLKSTFKKIPDSVTLIQFSGGILDKRTLLIKGKSAFLSTIFRFKDNLVTLKECQNPKLISVEQTPGNGGNEQLAFHMECTLI